MANYSQILLVAVISIHIACSIITHGLERADTIPMTSDGWRPIISSEELKHMRRPQVEQNNQQFLQNSQNIQQQFFQVQPSNNHMNLGQPASAPALQQSFQTSFQIPTNYVKNILNQASNTRVQSTGSSGSQQPVIGFKTQPSAVNSVPFTASSNVLKNNFGSNSFDKTQNALRNPGVSLLGVKGHKVAFRHPVIGKLQAHMALSAKRHKPISQYTANTNRDEIFVPPPPSLLASYAYFLPGSKKTALSGQQPAQTVNKPYVLQQSSNSHLEFPLASNNHHFSTPNYNEDGIQHSGNQQYLKPFTHFPFVENEYSKHLVPPPPYKPVVEIETKRPETMFEKEPKPTETVLITPPTNYREQIVIGKHKTEKAEQGLAPQTHINENINSVFPETVPQLSPPFHISSIYATNQRQNIPNVELEITKEKFNVFHNEIPPNYSPHNQNGNFFNVKDAVTITNNGQGHTYEVTEGKIDEHVVKIPQKQYQIHEEPFLPTPYQPDVPFPTIPTVNEIPTYSQIAPNQGDFTFGDFPPTNQPHIELSTHYNRQEFEFPIAINTQLSGPMKEPQHISYGQNEVTTTPENDLPPVLPTLDPANFFYPPNNHQEIETTTLKPTKAPRITTTTVASTKSRQRNPNHRRRRPTRPSNIRQKIRTTTEASFEQYHREKIPVKEIYEETQDTDTQVYQNHRQEYSRPRKRPLYKTTHAPEMELLTSVQPTIEPTIPIKTIEIENNEQKNKMLNSNQYEYEVKEVVDRNNNHRYTSTNHKYVNEDSDYKQSERVKNLDSTDIKYRESSRVPQKQRTRPSVFVDAFEDTDYTSRPKYHDDTKSRHRYTDGNNHKVIPVRENISEIDDTPDFVKNEKIVSTRGKQRLRLRPTEQYEQNPYAFNEQTVYQHRPEYVNIKSPLNSEYIEETKYTYPITTTQQSKTTTEHANEFITEIFVNTRTPENEIINTNDNENIGKIPTENIKPEIELQTPEYTTIVVPIETTEKILTTVEPTTTTTTTTNPNRIRTRPNRYDVTRPRFSVKDYKQRLLTTTEPSRETTTFSSTSRIRMPPRIRLHSTTESSQNENSTPRTKFIPKNNRHKETSNSDTETDVNTTTEKNAYRIGSNRLRPSAGKYYNRYRSTSTTETVLNTPTVVPTKVVFKSNTLLSSLKRPPPISLRTRILNKQKAQNVTTTTNIPIETENLETDDLELTKTETIPIQTTNSLEMSESKIEKWTMRPEESQIGIEALFDQHKKDTSTIENDENESASSYLQSQRVADLTQSASKDYNTPGLFKTVSPTSRRVPSYFTIATDDPILPIEAFFPKLANKN